MALNASGVRSLEANFIEGLGRLLEKSLRLETIDHYPGRPLEGKWELVRSFCKGSYQGNRIISGKCYYSLAIEGLQTAA